MKIKTFSKKQGEIFKFIREPAHALICDGAVRSGKTLTMTLAFLIWAMGSFDRTKFAICGKTVTSAQRNIILPLQEVEGLPYQMEYKVSEHMLLVRCGARENYFYIYGGKDESSYMLIQGITLAGVLFDEVALMPQSFVDQAISRTLTYADAKLWFNCNPEGPNHWFRTGWLLKAEKRDCKHLHFLMTDNPILSEDEIKRAELMFSGVFYDRYIKGEWVAADGLIYSMLEERNLYSEEERPKGLAYIARRTIALDYGTANPTVFLDIYDDGRHIWVDNEYRWDSHKENRQKTDREYGLDMDTFMGDDPQFRCGLVVDPSAASFIRELRSKGYAVTPAENDVMDGIRVVSTLLSRGLLHIHRERCKGLLDEMRAYVWDKKAEERGDEKPLKASDHGPDALRYYCYTILPGWRIGLEGKA